ncbi:MAG: serine hydrolase [Candidatus Marinimicrobia bacterium]|jgi:CubicO group peptidase (beta-lactamase class C family)|nr:serine hydrolase [Candidatus Neomarinimicrobiota bacterium]MDP6611116.1 serine hydrolase [Candidatus Neomarinimicrobiota bacterium]|tara:strand:+ start:2865 stop:4430 length:1566 start_codon:yes stop_codon:yes gene_type:complete
MENQKHVKIKINSCINYILKIALIILVAFPSSEINSQNSIPSGLENRIIKINNDWDLPGLAVAIIKDNKVIYAKGFGVRELGKSTKVNEKTLFAIGSTTKAMTAATLAMLVDEKKLTWNDRVIDLLPGFRMYDAYATNEMQVKDLLTHKSGLTRGDMTWYASPRNQEEVMHSIRYLKPAYSFRSEYNYQNLMYLTAGILSGRIHGDSWHSIMNKRIFKPLKMKTSVTKTSQLSSRNNVARPHVKLDGRLQPIKDRNLDNISPAGSVYSNVLEMSNWIILNMNKGKFQGEQILSESVLNEMHKPQMHYSYRLGIPEEQNLINFKTYGLGWAIDDYRGHKRISHGGGIDGFITSVGFLPDIELGWVVFNNGGSMASYFVGNEIIDSFLGVSDKLDWSAIGKEFVEKSTAQADSLLKDIESNLVKNTSPRLANKGFVGEYSEEFYGELQVSQDGNKLVLSRGDALKGILEHWHYDTFRVNWDEPRERASLGKEFITFHFNIKNDVALLERHLDGQPKYFKKINK